MNWKTGVNTPIGNSALVWFVDKFINCFLNSSIISCPMWIGLKAEVKHQCALVGQSQYSYNLGAKHQSRTQGVGLKSRAAVYFPQKHRECRFIQKNPTPRCCLGKCPWQLKKWCFRERPLLYTVQDLTATLCPQVFLSHIVPFFKTLRKQGGNLSLWPSSHQQTVQEHPFPETS